MNNGRTPFSSEALFPHVLVVSNHWGLREKYPAAGIFVDRQLSSLSELGIRIDVFDIGTKYSPFQLLKKLFQLRRIVRILRPDIIHGQYGTIVGTLVSLAGGPAVISFCGADLIPAATVSPARRYIGFILSNLAALRAKSMICKSKQLREALWWNRNKAVVIPSGVDLDLFSPGSQEDARKELGWEIGVPTAFFSAGGDPQNKGFELVNAAMEVVRCHVPNAALRVVTHNVDPRRMPLYFRAADVLLCASKWEGSPNVVKEALACNLPVVSTPVGDVCERLEGVYPSEIVPREPNAFGEAAARILIARQRCNGREHVINLGLQKVAERLLEVYRCVVHDSLG